MLKSKYAACTLALTVASNATVQRMAFYPHDSRGSVEREQTTRSLALLAAGLLVACGGGLGRRRRYESPRRSLCRRSNSRVSAGTAPADAGLGQPFDVQWVLPTGVSIASVVLDATSARGPAAYQGELRRDRRRAGRHRDQRQHHDPQYLLSSRPLTRSSFALWSRHRRPDNDSHPFVRRPGVSRLNLPAAARAAAGPANHDRQRRADREQGGLPLRPDDLDSNVAGEAAVNGGLQIRGRGNSTWDLIPRNLIG